MRFDELVREHHRAIHAHVRVVYPSAECDAVVNAVFTQLWEHFDELPPGAVRTWLRTAARHEVLNAARRAHRWYALSDRVAQLDHTHAVPATVDARLELDAVLSALSTLPPGDREMLLMTAMEDLTIDEVAAILGVLPNTAKVRLSRARAKLRAAVARIDAVARQGEGA